MPDPVSIGGQLGFDPAEYPDDPAFSAQLDVCFADVAASISGGAEGEVPRLDPAGEAEAYEISTSTMLRCMNSRGFEANVDSSQGATEFVWIGVTDPDDPEFVEASYACSEEALNAELAFRLAAAGG